MIRRTMMTTRRLPRPRTTARSLRCSGCRGRRCSSRCGRMSIYEMRYMSTFGRMPRATSR